MNKTALEPRLIVLFALLLTAAVYTPALFGGFFTDDFVYIVDNDKLFSIPWIDIWKIFFTPTNNYEYLPVRDLSYWIDYSLSGIDHAAFISHNIILYILGCAVIWPCCKYLLIILDRNLAKNNDALVRLNWMLVFIVVLFAFHPAHVESVAWASGRKDLLSGLFFLCCLWQFSAAIAKDTVSRNQLALAALFFILALGSKAATLSLAGIMLVLVLVRFRDDRGWEFGSNLKTIAIFLLLIFAIASIFLFIFINIAGDSGTAYNASQITIEGRPNPVSLAAKIQGYLLGLSIFPVQPRLIYDVTKPGVLGYISTISGVLIFFTGAAGLIAVIKKKWLVPAFFSVFFVLICLPYLQFIPFKTWSLASERFVFLAVIAPIACFAYFAQKLEPTTARIIMTVLAICYLTVTLSYSLDWRSESLLWKVASVRSPESEVVQSRYIMDVLIPSDEFVVAIESARKIRNPATREILTSFILATKDLKDSNLEGANKHARNMQQLLNHYSDPAYYFLIGEVAEKNKDLKAALRNYFQAGQNSRFPGVLKKSKSAIKRVQSYYAQALDNARLLAKSNPSNISVLGNLANLEMELYLHSEAATKYKTILEKSPQRPIAHYNLGLISMREGSFGRAADQIEDAIGLELNIPRVLNNLGKARRNNGEPDLAKEAFQQAIDLDPSNCIYRINLLRITVQQEDYRNAKNILGSINAISCEQQYSSILSILRDKIE